MKRYYVIAPPDIAWESDCVDAADKCHAWMIIDTEEETVLELKYLPNRPGSRYFCIKNDRFCWRSSVSTVNQHLLPYDFIFDFNDSIVVKNNRKYLSWKTIKI